MPSTDVARTPLAAIACLLLLGAGAARAQADPLDAIDRLQGEARMGALVAGARKDGEVMVYHSTQSEDLKPLFDAFTKKYGVKVKEWRSSSENVAQRTTSEAHAGRNVADLIESNSPEMEALRREKLLRRMDSPHFADMRRGTLGAHHTYATSTMDVFVQAYDTDKIKREDLPKSYRDLLDPRWKGQLGVEAEDSGWFGTLLDVMGPEVGAKLFHDIVATNGISARKGHTLLAKQVASGEIPLALTVYNYKPTQLKAKGEHIDWFVLPPAIAQLHAVAVLTKAPHPYAAALLYDFFLGEGQALLAERNFVPSSRYLPSPIGNTPLRFIDPAESIDKETQWRNAFEATILRRH